MALLIDSGDGNDSSRPVGITSRLRRLRSGLPVDTHYFAKTRSGQAINIGSRRGRCGLAYAQAS
jgi:hypothetical protein